MSAAGPEGGNVWKFPKLPKRPAGEIDDLNERAQRDHADVIYNAYVERRPLPLESSEKMTPDEIAEGILSKYRNDPKAITGVEYRLPPTRDQLAALLQEFVDLPSNYSRRYMLLVAQAYQATTSAETGEDEAGSGPEMSAL